VKAGARIGRGERMWRLHRGLLLAGARNGPRVTLHTQVTGEPARWLDEMKESGFVTSYIDAVLQGIVLLRRKYVALTSTMNRQPGSEDAH